MADSNKGSACIVVCHMDINCGETCELDSRYMYLCGVCAGKTTGLMSDAVRVRRQGDVK